MINPKVDFNLYIEKLKLDKKFDTYIETLVYFIEYESDQEITAIAKHLNKKIVEEIKKEASADGLIDIDAVIPVI